MKSRYPLVVIGAGPAGMAAAATAASHGLETALLDEQSAPGGQIYRNIEGMPEQRARRLGSEFRHGATLVKALRDSGAASFHETQVWSLKGDGEIGLVHEGRARLIRAEQVIIATGAQERPVPFPGWTLPGVMNAGAGQILLKQAGMVPEEGVVLAGSGPLLLLLAWQYLREGVTVEAVLDVQPLGNWFRAVPHLPRALLAHHYITKGLGYKRDLKAAGVTMLHGIQDLRALGGDRVHAVELIHRGKLRRLETPLLLSHFGVIPQTQLSEAAGCAHHWDRAQQCRRPTTDIWGCTDIPAIAVAGDGAGIGGARTAEHAGCLSAYQALHKAGRLSRRDRDRMSRKDRRWMKDELLIRPFLDALYRPPTLMLAHPTDEQLVCRCEEVTAGQVRQALDEGHRDPNAVKFFTRAGMGPCQGRQCAHAVAHLVSFEQGRDTSEVVPYRVRPPVKPVTLGQMAALETESGG